MSIVIGAARVYFLTQQRRAKRVNSGKLDESRTNITSTKTLLMVFSMYILKVRNQRKACSVSTSLTAQEKERIMKILVLDFMSSEETGSESGSGSEMTTGRKVFLSRSLPWKSPEASGVMESLDRKVERRHSERAREMCRVRRSGLPSSRTGSPSSSSSSTGLDRDQ